MKKLLTTAFLLIIISFGCFANSSLEKSGEFPCLIVNGNPILILGGELGNSAATSADDISSVLNKVKEMNLNTVLIPAYWDLMEPEEGVFDFSLTDSVINHAERNDLNVVFLWFGAWKNSMSCYAPEWVKKDTRRFPRARTKEGKPLEILSAFSPEVAKVDLNAFENWYNHILEYDKNGTVIMIQVENEIGMLEDARDHSDIAKVEYEKGVPEELITYILKNQDSLHPFLLKKWSTNGKKTTGSWKEVFGDDIFTDEIFMAWNYARYVEALASAGKKLASKPLYLNAALNSRGRLPGEYPSAGPLAHLKDIWHAGAPSIDFLSPDIYDTGFEDWVNQYALADNFLFVPEVRRDLSNPAQAYYIIGHHKALGISPFSIENGDENYANSMAQAYSVINDLSPFFFNAQYKVIDGVILNKDKKETVLKDDSVKITLSHFFTLPWDPRAADKNNWNDAGAVLIKLGPDEYILAGNGVVAKFEDEKEISYNTNLGEDGFLNEGNDRSINKISHNSHRIGLAKVEEVKILPDGNLKRIRTLNGDETHQGRHARIGVDDHKILHIKTYRYQ